MNPLYNCPEVLAFLQNAKENPDDDTPRLVLADWLEEHDESARAEFIRLQCRLASDSDSVQHEAIVCREEELLERYGGDWLGPLWTWRPTEYSWRRGLLAIRLARPSVGAEHLEDVLPWIDALHAEIHGWEMWRRFAGLLNRGMLNHVGLTLRRLFAETALLDCLSGLGELPCLHTLAFWCVRPAGRRPAGTPTSTTGFRPGKAFLSALCRFPLCRHLTQLGLGPRLTPKEASLIRELGIEPLDTQSVDWIGRPVLATHRTSTPRT